MLTSIIIYTRETENQMQYIQYYQSPASDMVMTGNHTSLTGLWFINQKDSIPALSQEYKEQPLAVFDQTRKWLDIYFSGKEPDFTPPLSMEATPFRKMVWEILLTIPYGQTTTYGAIANKIAAGMGLARMSAQAMGQAVGHNPISIIVPCHRVIGADGNLTGYAGGIDLKVKLLTLEKIDLSSMHLPAAGTRKTS